MYKQNALIFSVLVFMMSANNAFACDSKSCESAYLAETQQHIANHNRRAEASKVERHAYSTNRHRRAYALFVHHHFMRFSRELNEDQS